jgi:hypothetical protein
LMPHAKFSDVSRSPVAVIVNRRKGVILGDALLSATLSTFTRCHSRRCPIGQVVRTKATPRSAALWRTV